MQLTNQKSQTKTLEWPYDFFLKITTHSTYTSVTAYKFVSEM